MGTRRVEHDWLARELIVNVLVSSAQQSDSVIDTHLYVLFQILFMYRLLPDFLAFTVLCYFCSCSHCWRLNPHAGCASFSQAENTRPGCVSESTQPGCVSESTRPGCVSENTQPGCGGTACVRGACKMRLQREQEKDQAYRPVFLFRTRTTEEVHI